jgi:hypothetical protein
MRQHDPAARLSLADLPATSTSLVARVQPPLLPAAPGRRSLGVRYLRRKPGRGLAVTYTVEAGPAGRGARAGRRVSPAQPPQVLSLTLDELKIVTRRIHRLNSSRSQELSAMLGEIAACLAAEARRQ